jgi:hypothetical protein
MRPFEIALNKPAGSPPDAPVGIAIGSNDLVFTQLIRQGDNGAVDEIQAPPGQLAFWLVDNWWRLVSECVPSSGPGPEWRLAHELASIGGFAWPRLSIWGEGDRIGLSSRSDPVGVVGPVRYLVDALTYVSLAEFEAGSGAFLAFVGEERAGLASDWAALQSQIAALTAEKADPDIAAWRRLEAELGYDVDSAPDELMGAMKAFVAEYGAGAVAEAALAAQGQRAAAVLQEEIARANEQHWQCDLTRTALMVGEVDRTQGLAPWELGELAAATVRQTVGYPDGPLSNAVLGDVLNVRASAFRTQKTGTPREQAYGLRLNTGRRRGEVVSLASSWSADRRFEFARALGDAVWTQGERLGPLTRTKSERQKFQRAFAQSLLCPHADLVAYIGDDTSDGALSAAAKHFLVSERVVRTLLVNKHALARRRLGQIARPANDLQGQPVAFEDAVEAA